MNTTIKWLALNETFRPPICKSPLAESLAPYWMINGSALSDMTVNNRYGAEVNRLSNDDRGRHQAELVIHSVNAMLNGSNISCAVGSKLRRVYMLYIIGPGMYVLCVILYMYMWGEGVI